MGNKVVAILHLKFSVLQYSKKKQLKIAMKHGLTGASAGTSETYLNALPVDFHRKEYFHDTAKCPESCCINNAAKQHSTYMFQYVF